MGFYSLELSHPDNVDQDSEVQVDVPTVHHSSGPTENRAFRSVDSVSVFRNGSELYPRMIEAIHEAQDVINLEVYIFGRDRVGDQFVEALVEASNRNVDVRVILDAWGSFTFPTRMQKLLDKAGVELIRYRPISPFTGRWGWRRRDHRKLLSIDGYIGFLGGINISEEYLTREEGGLGIRDTHFELQGSVVEQMNGLFSYNWENHKHGLDDWLAWLPDFHGSPEEFSPLDEPCARIVGGWWQDKNLILEDFLHQIREADNRIRITNAYFLPNKSVLEALYDAVERGCDVQLLVPGQSNVPPVQYGTRYLYRDLLDHGIEVYEYQYSMLHAKTVVLDDDWVIGGTFNFDYQSLFHNLEINVTVNSREFAETMNQMFDTDLLRSHRVTYEELDSWNWYRKFLARFWYFFRWLL